MNIPMIARKMEEQGFTKKETDEHIWQMSLAEDEDRHNADIEPKQLENFE